MNYIQTIIILAPAFLLALTVHEFAHGYTAYRFGDPTAKQLGRLTLNPLKHLDPMGTIIFFIARIGWAKPVPVNPRYFKNPEREMLLVSLAGPGANLLLALFGGLVMQILLFLQPIIPQFFLNPMALLIGAIVWVNLMLAIFNLIPIPPLDGSHILANILPRGLAASYARMGPYGLFILIFLLYFTGIVPKFILPLVDTGTRLIIG